MILTCPSCTKRFLLDAALLGTGRRVKCGACGHVWFQEPPVGAAAPAPSLSPRRAPRSELDALSELMAERDPDLPPPETTPAGTDSLSRLRQGRPVTRNLPALPDQGGSRRGAWLRWGGLVVVVAGLAASVLLLQEPVMRLWPPAARLYETLGLWHELGAGLAIPGDRLKSEFRDVEGNPMLFVSGEVVNISDAAQPVPDVEVTAVGEDGKALFSWRVVPSARRAFPKQAIPFQSTTPERGGPAKSISVRFVAPEAPAPAH
ncbi:zinc-ribbon domain-containing protein [Oleisolibacter albus]|uniref:zinc-ribbon domain-containing protein n=1 Tax=Oleisolibacter albus TaxID=2171757 RepID=UPI000DF188F3|nr:zinc-ribbon domain-containing protein [Oleisolibacter albus]